MAGIARGVSYVFLAQVVRMAAKGGLVLLLTRYLLEPAEYGLLFLTIAILSLSLLFANLGLAKAGARYVTEYRETSPELIPTVLARTVRYRVVAIAITCVGLVLLHGPIAAAVGEPAIGVLLVVGTGYVAAKSLTETAVVLFQGFDRMDLTALLRVVSNVLLVILVPSLVFLGFGLAGAIAGYAISSAVAAALGLGVLYVRFYAPRDVAPRARSAVSERILRYSVPLTMTMGANVVKGRADTILLSVFRGPTAIAYYTLGKQIADFLIAPAHSLGFGISPSLGERKASGEMGRAARLYERSFTYTVTLYGPAAAGVVLVASPAVTLVFGTDYAGAVPVLQIFSLFVVVRALDAITSDALDYLGRARARAIAKGGLALGNVALNLVLIPPYGVVGATVATVLTHGVYVGAELYIVADELPIDRRRLARSSLVVGGITAGTAAVVYPLAGHISDVPSLIGVICAGVVAWLVLTVASGAADPRRLSAALTP